MTSPPRCPQPGDNFSLSSLLVSFLGAVILLGIVNLLRRGKIR